MKTHVRLSDEFGVFCADGERAAAFRAERIDPFIGVSDLIEIDFDGIRRMNSSFANALVANLVSQAGRGVLDHICFLNCCEAIRLQIRSAIELGLSRLQQTGREPSLI